MKRTFRIFLLFIIMGLMAFAATVQAEDSGQQKRHPTYNLMGRDAAQSPSSPLNPNFVESPEARLSESGFWRSSYIDESLVGLVVADIDRDGLNEIVYASSRNIFVSKIIGGKLQQLAKYSTQGINIVSLDAMDLTGDGRMEIICSAQDENKGASAIILSFNGESLSPLAERIPWYLRVIGPSGSQFLAGQKAGTNKNTFYSGNVMRMKYSGGKVSSQGKVGLPSFVNVFNFTMGRIGSGGLQITAAIKFPSEHIFLFEGTNQAWESREEYGGTMNFLEPVSSGSDNASREYLPARILLSDIDGDGQNELIVAKNDRGGVAFMSKLRAFSGGAMQAFKYSNMSLSPFFRSRSLPGVAVDYALADFNNNGTMDLVVAVVTEQKSGMMVDGRSVIVAYELSAPANNQ